ncbi:hypothetical protein DPMN_067783 [Dreissena polymorpha]|uniref:Uncharacterized protein n=1 Tax=Dreissena polymorpha TaxID=45954 RepID=A0A9D4BT23_DREPO|nr:hypothetical protein DPMN_067783 [Dreissena polymorpha]
MSEEPWGWHIPDEPLGGDTNQEFFSPVRKKMRCQKVQKALVEPESDAETVIMEEEGGLTREWTKDTLEMLTATTDEQSSCSEGHMESHDTESLAYSSSQRKRKSSKGSELSSLQPSKVPKMTRWQPSKAPTTTRWQQSKDTTTATRQPRNAFTSTPQQQSNASTKAPGQTSKASTTAPGQTSNAHTTIPCQVFYSPRTPQQPNDLTPSKRRPSLRTAPPQPSNASTTAWKPSNASTTAWKQSNPPKRAPLLTSMSPTKNPCQPINGQTMAPWQPFNAPSTPQLLTNVAPCGSRPRDDSSRSLPGRQSNSSRSNTSCCTSNAFRNQQKFPQGFCSVNRGISGWQCRDDIWRPGHDTSDIDDDDFCAQSLDWGAKRKKWTWDETVQFYKATIKIGFGKWSKIRKDLGTTRTGLQLKDKWRNIIKSGDINKLRRIKK